MTSDIETWIRGVVPQGQVVRVWLLQGGVSAQTTGVQVRTEGGETNAFVVRQHQPEKIVREAYLYEMLSATAIPIPRLHMAHLAEPVYLIQALVDGQTDFAPADLARYLDQLAQMLMAIHRVPLPQDAMNRLPIQIDRCEALLKQRSHMSSQVKEICELMSCYLPQVRNRPNVLLHGDFWPGNILWNQERIVAVIDWEDAAIGDPLADVANTRLELLWFFGRQAMQSFTDAYHAAANERNEGLLAFWDLYAALKMIGHLDTWGLDCETLKRFRQRRDAFIKDAMRQLQS